MQQMAAGYGAVDAISSVALSEGTKLCPKKLNLQGLTDSDGHCIAVRKQ